MQKPIQASTSTVYHGFHANSSLFFQKKSGTKRFWKGICQREANPNTMATQSKILLLDDNRDLLQIVQIILKGQGYETVLASSIEEAEKKIRIYQPALIMMDVYVGDQNGCDLCKQVKHEADMVDTRIILMSGDENCSTLADYAGADDFMTKPFDYNDLLERVQRQMQVKRVTAQ
jgi:DNA-binding response OmpR family regulator